MTKGPRTPKKGHGASEAHKQLGTKEPMGATRQMGNKGGGIKRSTHTGTRGILQEPGKLLALQTERPPHL